MIKRFLIPYPVLLAASDATISRYRQSSMYVATTEHIICQNVQGQCDVESYEVNVPFVMDL
jgi:hypothetical protein